MRVQIPAYTDKWMQGDRFGEVVKTARYRILQAGLRAALLSETHGSAEGVEMAHVKLDKSGKTIRVVLDDCTVV